DAMMKAGKISAEVGIDALNQVLNDKMGGIAQRQLLDIGVQWDKFKDSIKALFADINTQPFLNALHSVLSLFDQNTASGKRLKAITEDFYNFLFKAFEGVDGSGLEKAFGFLLDALEGAVGLFKFLLPYMQAIGGGFITGLTQGFHAFSAVLQTIGKAFGGLGTNDTLIKFLTMAGKGFAYLI